MSNHNTDNLKECYCSLEENCKNQNEIEILTKFSDMIYKNCEISMN